ncbi:MAG: DUF3995 domain-containing protein [Mycobacteriales bacterium]|nr:MAG: DUF3995 domain-containing protein [Pseudonocardiales bacterium]
MRPSQLRTAGGRTAAAWVAAVLALVVGGGYAVVSGYWAVGGTGLLDTVGGVFQRAGRSGGTAVVVALWIVVAIKLIAAVLPLLVLRPALRRGWRRVVWTLAWVDAVILTLYGLVLTTTGLLVQADVVQATNGADHRALAWHAYLWDPWFLVWGLLVGAALLCRRPQPELSAIASA